MSVLHCWMTGALGMASLIDEFTIYHFNCKAFPVEKCQQLKFPMNMLAYILAINFVLCRVKSVSQGGSKPTAKSSELTAKPIPAQKPAIRAKPKTSRR